MGRNAGIDARRVKALDLRLAGASYREIGVALGVSGATAFKDVDAIMREVLTEPAERVRAMELARLDALLKAHWSRALAGNGKAGSMVLSIMDRRMKLLGLDIQRIDLRLIQEIAEENDLDVAEVLAEAEKLVRKR